MRRRRGERRTGAGTRALPISGQARGVLGNAAMRNSEGRRYCPQPASPGHTAAVEGGGGEGSDLDVEAVCEALRQDVDQLLDADVERFAEVLSAIAAAVGETLPRSEPPCNAASVPLPEVIAGRLLFACAIIFPAEDLDRIRAFVLRQLGAGGLLRLRLRA